MEVLFQENLLELIKKSNIIILILVLTQKYDCNLENDCFNPCSSGSFIMHDSLWYSRCWKVLILVLMEISPKWENGKLNIYKVMNLCILILMEMSYK